MQAPAKAKETLKKRGPGGRFPVVANLQRAPEMAAPVAVNIL
jgi:hypothetical protein